MGEELVEGGTQGDAEEILHLRVEEVFGDVVVLVEVVQGQDVALLELTVVGGVLLDGVVGEVSEAALVAHAVLLAGHAHVALLEEVDLLGVAHHHPHPDVELSLHYQQRLLDVLLKDVVVFLIFYQLRF